VGALMADLDKFKRVNDAFGHLAGDSVLRQFARILTASVGPDDTVARLGGDEFVVLLPGADANEALAVADTVKRQTRAWTQGSRIAAGLDVSIGMAVWTPDTEGGIDALLRAADEAMYQEKELKRASTAVTSPGPS
ncbi:MAG TPA: GGDEF domain-containing protein, partial [Firmicutes bacterium]|nr:GGDEF domain-containing protein [Bacillota bacterium]